MCARGLSCLGFAFADSVASLPGGSNTVCILSVFIPSATARTLSFCPPVALESLARSVAYSFYRLVSTVCLRHGGIARWTQAPNQPKRGKKLQCVCACCDTSRFVLVVSRAGFGRGHKYVLSHQAPAVVQSSSDSAVSCGSRVATNRTGTAHTRTFVEEESPLHIQPCEGTFQWCLLGR